MSTVLKNNKNLLKKRNFLNSEKSFFLYKKEYIKAANGEIELRKANKSQLRAIRKKIKEQRTIKLITHIFILCFVMVFSCILVYNLAFDSNQIKEKEEQSQLEKTQNQYLLLIADGDQWFSKRNWHNAIFQYKKAREIYPSDYGINYRLVQAYCLRCENDYEDCQNAKELLDKLLNQFPKKPELLKLKEILKYEY